MAAKNDNITKDPAAAGKKGAVGRRGKKNAYTIIKEKLLAQGITWAEVEAVVENNILDFLTSNNRKERLLATRFFSEFVKPKKKEMSGDVKLTIDDIIDEDE